MCVHGCECVRPGMCVCMGVNVSGLVYVCVHGCECVRPGMSCVCMGVNVSGLVCVCAWV